MSVTGDKNLFGRLLKTKIQYNKNNITLYAGS